MKIVVAVTTPLYGSVAAKLVQWLCNLPAHARGRGHPIAVATFEQSSNHAAVRNSLVKWFLENDPDADVLWMVDADMIPYGPDLPDGGLDYMLKMLERDDVDVASGISFRLNPELQPVPCIIEFDRDREKVIEEFGRERRAFEAKNMSTGGACLAVKRRVLEAFAEDQEPPFNWTFKSGCEDWGKTHVGEDTWFIRRCQQRGFRFWIDTRLVWGHIKKGDLREELWRAENLIADMEADKT